MEEISFRETISVTRIDNTQFVTDNVVNNSNNNNDNGNTITNEEGGNNTEDHATTDPNNTEAPVAEEDVLNNPELFDVNTEEFGNTEEFDNTDPTQTSETEAVGTNSRLNKLKAILTVNSEKFMEDGVEDEIALRIDSSYKARSSYQTNNVIKGATASSVNLNQIFGENLTTTYDMYTNQYLDVYFINCTITYENVDILVSTTQDKTFTVDFISRTVGTDFLTQDCKVYVAIKKTAFNVLRDCNLEGQLIFDSRIKQDLNLLNLNALKQQQTANNVITNAGSTTLVLVGLSFKQILQSFLLFLNSISLIDLIPLLDFKYSDKSANSISPLTLQFDYWFNYTNNTAYRKEFQTNIKGLFPKVLAQKEKIYATEISVKFLLFILGFILLLIDIALPNKIRKRKPAFVKFIINYIIGFSDSFILSESVDFFLNYFLQYKYIVQTGFTFTFVLTSFIGMFSLGYGYYRTVSITKKFKYKADVNKFFSKYELFFPFIIPNYTKALYYNSYFILRNILLTFIVVFFHSTFYLAISIILVIQGSFVYFNYAVFTKMPNLPIFSGFFTECSIFVIFIAFACHDFLGEKLLIYIIIFVYFAFSTTSLMIIIYTLVKSKVKKYIRLNFELDEDMDIMMFAKLIRDGSNDSGKTNSCYEDNDELDDIEDKIEEKDVDAKNDDPIDVDLIDNKNKIE